MGKSTISTGPFSMAMLIYQRVSFSLKNQPEVDHLKGHARCQRHRFFEVVKLLWEYVNATKKYISPAPISKDPQPRHHPRGLFLDWKSRLSAYILNQMPAYQGLLFSKLDDLLQEQKWFYLLSRVFFQKNRSGNATLFTT